MGFSISCTCNVAGSKVYYNCYAGINTCPSMDLLVTTDTGRTLVLVPPVWEELSIGMVQVREPTSLAPTWTSYKGSQIPMFSPTLVNALYFSAQLPHSYKEGTDLEFHIHIAYPDNNVGSSVWYFTYSWANVGDTFPVQTMSPQVIVASPTTTDAHQRAEIVAIMDGTGKTISSVLLCMIQRTGTHGSDDYPSGIYLLSSDFLYQIDTLGSRTMTAK